MPLPATKRGLPPPPSHKTVGRPLPPEPQIGGGGDDAPPPLPSRPGHKPTSLPQLPPIGKSKRLQTPSSSDDEDQQTYEEADTNVTPRQQTLPPPPKQETFQQETYDELHDVMALPSQPADDGPTETYDEFEMNTGNQETWDDGQQLYEAPEDDFEEQVEEEVEEEASECFYEYVPEPATDERLPPPPSPNNPIPPQRPPPKDHREKAQSPENLQETPISPRTQPVPKKKLTIDGAPHFNISQALLGSKMSALKKFNSADVDKPKEEKSALSQSETNSVRDKILKFKQGDSGDKPPIMQKPLLNIATLPAKPIPPVVKSPVNSPPVPPVNKSPVISAPPKPACVSDIPSEDNIYDDGSSYVPDPLDKEEWYHGEIERADAERKLKNLGLDGSFLVRKSKQGGDSQPYTLVVLFEKHTYNLKMRLRNDKRVALGEEKPDELSFTDVPALINHHKINDVILVNKTEKKQHKTLLKKFPIC